MRDGCVIVRNAYDGVTACQGRNGRNHHAQQSDSSRLVSRPRTPEPSRLDLRRELAVMRRVVNTQARHKVAA